MDEELARLDAERERAARFGTLPARIHPDTTVEMVETRSPQDKPESAGTDEQRRLLFDGS